MNKLPVVSICIPTFNAESTIHETLLSILNQTYNNISINIVDNASDDNTLAIVESFADPRICVHRYNINVGGEGNFNRCIQLGSGKYTAIFHADDIYDPDMVSTQVAFLENNSNAAAVFTEAHKIDENGNIFGTIIFPKELASPEHLYDFPTLFKAVLKHSNIFVCPSAMVRTTIYQNEIKKWRGDIFRSSADLDVWLRISQLHQIGLIPRPLMRYRISKSQFSSQLRQRTHRADLFLVLDYYLAQEHISTHLSLSDRRHFRWLERTDRIVRAVNLYIQGDITQARSLSNDALSLDCMMAALHGFRGLATFLAAVSLQFFIFLHWHFLGKFLLIRMKRVINK
jgi:glycosyltransferase involved in cell wall biosynthesis